MLLVVLVGCADAGDPPVQTPLITVNNDSGFFQVVAPTYSMSFSQAGVHLPDHLIVGGHELLSTNPTNPCALEGLVGIGIFPALSIIAGDVGVNRTSSIDPIFTGPAVAKLAVGYDVDFMCGGTQTASGQAIFTLFPGGRIVREDRMVVPGSATLDSTSDPCGCETGGGTHFFFTTFWAFEDVLGDAAHVDRDGIPTQGGKNQGCTLYEDHAVGVSWNGTATRVHRNEVSSYIYDFATDQAQLPSSPQGMFSAIQVIGTDPGGPGECANILAPLQEAPIQIGDVARDATGDDGIYTDGAVVHRSPFDITTASGLPQGFAVSVDLGGSKHVGITREPALPGEPAVLQPQDDRFILLFPDGLAPGERITVDPQ